MNFEVELYPALFTETPIEVLHAGKWSVIAKKYPSGIESLTITNDKGYVEVLPFMGQIIWDACFNGSSLRMANMFSQPQQANLIEDTYGCFAFHSGLLAAGCPSPEDTHPLHGEFSCAPMDKAKLVISDSTVTVESTREYVKGFGNHYLAKPSVSLHEGCSMFDIHLQVTNLSKYASMPLQYMCHLNYAFIQDGIMSQNLPEGVFQLRQSVPAHVKPTKEWTQLNRDIIAGKREADSLAGAEDYDPEIVFFADGVDNYTDYGVFNLKSPDGTVFQTEFATADFPVVTRWVLYNADQKVAAFALPGTSRPEGRRAAEQAGTLIHLAAGETRDFNVRTGVKEN